MLGTTADPSVRARAAGVGDTMDRLTRARAAAGLKRLTARFLRQTQGNVAMMFALALPVLLMITLGAIDIHQASKVKAQLQDALDAAALAAARSTFTDDVNINKVGLAALKANMPGYFGETSGDTANFVLLNNRVTGDARVNVKVLVANIVLPPYGKLLDDYLPVSTRSEVLRASRDIEVGLVLDVTGSMRGTRIASLKSAARELVQIVVQDKDKQSPFYSRLAIIPYSSGVNLNAEGIGFGDYREGARGKPPAAVRINDAKWTTGPVKSVSSISKASAAVITSNNHGFKDGEYVWIRGVRGMTQMNDRPFEVVNSKSNTFQVKLPGSSYAVNSSDYSSYSSSGSIYKCIVSDCSVVVTAFGHGLKAVDPDTNGPGTVYIRNVSGMTQINDQGFEIDHVTPDSFSIGVNGASYGAFRSGDGVAYCGYDGCEYRVYRNVSGGLRSYRLSDCVTERTGANFDTEISAAKSNVGRLYPSGSGDNMCTTSPLLPLTDDREAMYDLIGEASQVRSGLQAGGFTAGQIGLAWGWYAVSPEFGAFWPTPPAPYNPQRTLKAVILMTDGEFNMVHCGGVMARNSGTSGGDRIRCDASRDSYQQARALCGAIKKQGIVLYTVGFQVSANSNAGRFLSDCASGPEQFHIASSDGDLSEVFKAIGRDITRLRIAR